MHPSLLPLSVVTQPGDPQGRVWRLATAAAGGPIEVDLSDIPPAGLFRPCHSSSFDGAGRVSKNKPAPTNLEIPPHRYTSDTRLPIGESPVA